MVRHRVFAAGERVVDVVGKCLAEGFRIGTEHGNVTCILGSFSHKSNLPGVDYSIQGKFRNFYEICNTLIL